MIASLAKHSGLNTVRVAQLRFGKLVRDTDGPVHFDAGYAVTYKTPDLVGNGKCLPDALIGGLQLDESHMEPAFLGEGGLVFRLVQLPAGARVVAMRARLRPEAGEGRSGRNYVQATVLQTVVNDGWAGMPSGFPVWCVDELVACPDIFSVPLAERKPSPALDFEPDETPPPTREELSRLTGRRRARLVTIIRKIMEGGPLVIGSDGFDDDEHDCDDAKGRTRTFLADIGRAFAFLAAERVTIPPNLVIAAGFTKTILPGSVRLLVSQPSMPALDENLQALDDALARHNPGYSATRVKRIASGGWPDEVSTHVDRRQSHNEVHAQQERVWKYNDPGRVSAAPAVSRDVSLMAAIKEFEAGFAQANRDDHLVGVIENVSHAIIAGSFKGWQPFALANRERDGASDAIRCLALIVGLVDEKSDLYKNSGMHFSIAELIAGFKLLYDEAPALAKLNLTHWFKNGGKIIEKRQNILSKCISQTDLELLNYEIRKISDNFDLVKSSTKAGSSNSRLLWLQKAQRHDLKYAFDSKSFEKVSILRLGDRVQHKMKMLQDAKDNERK